MLEKVHNYIDLNFARHLNKTQEFLRIPNDSFSKSGLSETANWLKEYLGSLGGFVRFEGNKSAPIIVSTFELGNPQTLLVYGMYDVQPTSDQEWITPPFAAEIVDLPDLGPSLIARGACNSKGPLISFINVIEAFRASGRIPINLIFTIEGEEEIGSPTLPQFYLKNQEWLKSKVSACFEPFWSNYGTDVNNSIISLGSKGIISIELTCRGGEWGGPTRHSVHSSVGAWLSSPAWRLLKAVNTLVDDQENIVINNFNDDVLLPSPKDEELLIELSKSFNEKETLQTIGANTFKFKEHGVNLLRKYLFIPSIQLGPLTYGKGDVITPEAHIGLTVRLVPNMDPGKIIDKIRLHFNKLGYGDLEIKILAQYPSSRTNLHEKIVQDLLETYMEFGIEPQIWPMLASATPFYLFSDILKLPYIWGGLGQAGKSHVANEYATVTGLKLFEKSIASFIYKFANQ